MKFIFTITLSYIRKYALRKLCLKSLLIFEKTLCHKTFEKAMEFFFSFSFKIWSSESSLDNIIENVLSVSYMYALADSFVSLC